MLRIAVCDDDPAEIRMISRHADEYSIKSKQEIRVDGYSNGEELIEHYEKGKYDILFLDVEMDNLDGLAIAEYIRRLPDHDITIMYVSNYPEYMQASFNVRAAQYMTKPLSYETFESKINDIIKYNQEAKETIVEFHINSDIYFVNKNDLISIKSLSKIGKPLGIMVTTTDSSFNAKGRLRDYIETYSDFLVCPNRSILINAGFVRKFEGNRVVLKNGSIIEISRNKINEVKEQIRKNIMKRMDDDSKYN